MKVKKDIIDATLQVYKPEFRWLKEAEVFAHSVNGIEATVEHPVCIAKFDVQDQTYLVSSHNRVNCVEAQICINQITYAGWAQFLREKLVDIGMDAEEFISRGIGGSMSMTCEGRQKSRSLLTSNLKDTFGSKDIGSLIVL